MTIQEAYLSFINRVEKNMMNDGFEADRNRFIILFNESQIRFVEWILDKGNEDDRRAIQRLMVPFVRLPKKSNANSVETFQLPNDYLEFINISGTASKDSCGGSSIKLWEAKFENIEELLHDDFNKPSFPYRETFYTIGNDKVNVFTDNFTMEEVKLTYYRYPRAVDIEGYIRADGSISSNTHPEFDDRVVNRILTICAKRFAINEQDYNKLQAENAQVITKP